ncbi:sugar transferase [Polynucleobacter sp. AP-Titi-500A-B4]|uniref:sugar transferase n=1 Tax=Polynucleobacter sp. AP-Titi-500A-B4 TaxID=2576923 RepID=UPI001BFD58E6|nr:sugar transferase [Polynucleobacter sp. AP-Titi-500A-B4]QWE12824.1 sugar transferase [Polynucleobacter sp. AP-Titi-500A-B4]
MLIRLIDIAISLFGLLLLSPVLVVFLLLVYLQDFKNPIFFAKRVGRSGRDFLMYKMRSMVANAEKTGVNSTSINDSRITSIGRVIRRYKLDEVMQLINVLKGDMSLVGPRPQVRDGVNFYNEYEMNLLLLRPGITDLASIIFADEGDILKNSTDPDADYNLIIRPWKSRYALLYVNHTPRIFLYLLIVALTALAIVNRAIGLRLTSKVVGGLTSNRFMVETAARNGPIALVLPPEGGYDL